MAANNQFLSLPISGENLDFRLPYPSRVCGIQALVWNSTSSTEKRKYPTNLIYAFRTRPLFTFTDPEI